MQRYTKGHSVRHDDDDGERHARWPGGGSRLKSLLDSCHILQFPSNKQGYVVRSVEASAPRHLHAHTEKHTRSSLAYTRFAPEGVANIDGAAIAKNFNNMS